MDSGSLDGWVSQWVWEMDSNIKSVKSTVILWILFPTKIPMLNNSIKTCFLGKIRLYIFLMEPNSWEAEVEQEMNLPNYTPFRCIAHKIILQWLSLWMLIYWQYCKRYKSIINTSIRTNSSHIINTKTQRLTISAFKKSSCVQMSIYTSDNCVDILIVRCP